MTPSNTAFTGILLRVSTVPALRTAGPAVLIVLVVAFGLHGETTLTFKELGQLYVGEPWLRGVILVLWALVMAPAARLGVMSQGLTYLGWLPLPRRLIHAHLVGLLAALHALPVIPLFVAGFPAEGIGMWFTLMGIGASLMPGARSTAEHGLRALCVVGLVALVALGHWVAAFGLGLAVLVVRVPRVWRIAPEHSHWRSGKRWIVGGRWLALGCAQALHVWRGEAAALSRALLVSALGVFLIQLVVRANQGSISDGSLLVTSTPPIAALSIMLALVLKRSRVGLYWTVRSLGVSRTSERWISLALIAGSSGAFATVILILVSAKGPATVALLIHAMAWALLALGISSRSQEDVRSASITLAMSIFAMFTIGLGGRVMLGAELGLGLLVAGRALLQERSDA